jgi:hypothetical protein
MAEKSAVNDAAVMLAAAAVVAVDPAVVAVVELVEDLLQPTIPATVVAAAATRAKRLIECILPPDCVDC